MSWLSSRQEIPQRLNICIIATKFPILGRAADHGFLWPVARGLAKNHDVTVLSWKNPQGKPLVEQDGVKAYFLGTTGVAYSQFPELVQKKFYQLHKESPFHIVHSIDAAGKLVGTQRKKLKVAMTYDVEATHMSQIFSVVGMAQETIGSLLRTGLAVTYIFLKTYFTKDRHLLSTADGVFVTSPQQKLALERFYLYPDARTFQIPYGIEIGDLSPREHSEEFHKKLGIPGDARIIMTITDMAEVRELKSLLMAFEKVAIKKPSSRLIIVGEGPRKKEIEFEMLNLALGSKVVFAGKVNNNELPDYIALADVLVDLSARHSGFEPSLLEAMAQKKIIIGSEVSPISTIVEDGVDGFLIRPADVNNLARLLLDTFTNKLPAKEIGDRARNKVMNLFDTNLMVQQTIEAYHETLRNTGDYK